MASLQGSGKTRVLSPNSHIYLFSRCISSECLPQYKRHTPSQQNVCSLDKASLSHCLIETQLIWNTVVLQTKLLLPISVQTRAWHWLVAGFRFCPLVKKARSRLPGGTLWSAEGLRWCWGWEVVVWGFGRCLAGCSLSIDWHTPSTPLGRVCP